MVKLIYVLFKVLFINLVLTYSIHVPGYKWIGQNGLKYKRPSEGGVLGFFVRLELYTLYDIKLLYITIEGIIVLSLSHKQYY